MPMRPYDLVRTMVEEHGGVMWYEKKGHPHEGAWIIGYRGRTVIFPAQGEFFPCIDTLYVPKTEYPTSRRDFKNELIPDAWDVLVGYLPN